MLLQHRKFLSVNLRVKKVMEEVYYSLPQTGMLLLSSLATMEHMVMVTGMASKQEECGPMVRMGASEGGARSPITLIQWKPPQNHMARMITRRLRSMNLIKDTQTVDAKCSHIIVMKVNNLKNQFQHENNVLGLPVPKYLFLFYYTISPKLTC